MVAIELVGIGMLACGLWLLHPAAALVMAGTATILVAQGSIKTQSGRGDE